MKDKAYSEEFKEQVLREVEDTSNVALVARNNSIPSTTINTWIKRRKGSSMSNSSWEPKYSSFSSNNFNKEIKKENDTLKKILGKKDF